MFLWLFFDLDDFQCFSTIVCEKSKTNGFLEFSLQPIKEMKNHVFFRLFHREKVKNIQNH